MPHPRFLACLAFSIVLSAIQIGIACGETTEPELAAYREFAIKNTGEPAQGEEIFNNNRKLVCADCHRITGMEKSGPNLDGVGDKHARAELISHILEPSKIIKPGFGQATVLMQDGRSFTGRIERLNALIVRLLDTKGKRINLNQNDVDEIVYSEQSLMPSNLVSSISKEEFTDLVAYLGSLKFGIKDGIGAAGKTVPIPRLEAPIQFKKIHPPNVEFMNPVWCSPLPGVPNQLLVVEHQTARIWRFIRDDDNPRKELFLDLGDVVHIAGDQGLTSLALHPKYADNGRYFLEHEVREGGRVKTTIVERQATADGLRDSGKPAIRLTEVEQPAANHNGGCIGFGKDGMLYAGFGDGGPQRDPEGHSQSRSQLLGSMIRLDVDSGKPYSIPKDNPFIELSQKNPQVRPEIWATGFREPWRFSFDSLTGELYVGDVGQDKFEEVSLVKRGENHGWNVREAFAPFSKEFQREEESYVDPLFAYEHGLGFSVTGGYVYRKDPDSSFYGVYIFGDFNTRRVWGLRQSNGKLIDVRELGTAPGGIASFGVDHDGGILMVTYDGGIYQLALDETEYQ